MDNPAINIVDAIIAELERRAGFDEFWESIDRIERNRLVACLYGIAEREWQNAEQ